MIVIRLMGGLGNQLFQYAAGRQLAERLHTQLFLDTSWFEIPEETDTRRPYELDLFKCRSELADRALLNQFYDSDFTFSGRLRTELLSLGKYHKAKIYDYGFDARFEKLKDNTCLKGFFQSEKYFEGIKDKLREELVFRDAEKYLEHPLYPEIQNSLSVCLHVRRGDYVNNTSHGICGPDYYKNAILYLKEKTGSEIRLYVFSDDPEYARQEMAFPGAVFVDNSKESLRNIDLFLMSACKHQVIANSTYSWWAAWLNSYADKIVLAPEWWTNELKTQDIRLEMEGMHIIK